MTAFTLAHSLTLLASALHELSLPTQPVEILIACSIVVSGWHALRPLFAGREVLIAGAFGLVHGLAFASALQGFGFDAGSLALALLGFNLGIETLQLALVLLVLPCLVFAARSPHYTWLRGADAGVGIVAGLSWIAERALGYHSLVSAWAEALPQLGPWLIAVLALSALALNARQLRAALSRY